MSACPHETDPSKLEDAVLVTHVTRMPGGEWVKRAEPRVFCCELMAEVWLRGGRKSAAPQRQHVAKHHVAVIRNQEAPLPKIRAQQPALFCVCGMPRAFHPTKSCRTFFEKGL